MALREAHGENSSCASRFFFLRLPFLAVAQGGCEIATSVRWLQGANTDVAIYCCIKEGDKNTYSSAFFFLVVLALTGAFFLVVFVLVLPSNCSSASLARSSAERT